MSDDSEKKSENAASKDGATGDSSSPSASPRDKKTKFLTTEGETPVPGSRARPPSVQDFLVAGIAIYK